MNLYLSQGMAHKSYNLLRMKGSINLHELIYPVQLSEYSPLAGKKSSEPHLWIVPDICASSIIQ